MYTTLKVSIELRDRLKSQAAGEGRTIAEHLAVLADGADRSARFERLRAQRAATPPPVRASYLDEIGPWDTAAGDGLPAEDFSDWPGFAAS